jgi:hypothetical protein
MSSEDRRATLIEDASVILPALAALDGDDGVKAFIIIVSTAYAADGKLNADEYRLFCDVTGTTVDYSAACAMIDAANTRVAQNLIDVIVDRFGDIDIRIKESMVSFCLCFCAANGKITREEKRFIKQLIK